MRIHDIEEVYLEEAHFNPVCNCTIPGAWVAVVSGFKQAIGYPHDFKDTAEATAYAQQLFS